MDQIRGLDELAPLGGGPAYGETECDEDAIPPNNSEFAQSSAAEAPVDDGAPARDQYVVRDRYPAPSRRTKAND